MKKITTYRYLGVNGVIDSPVLLPDTPHITTVYLMADEGKYLTRDNKTFVTSVKVATEEEAALWKEVEGKNN